MTAVSTAVMTPPTPWKRVLRAVLADFPSRLALAVLTMIVLAAIVGPSIIPYGPKEQLDTVNLKLLPPSSVHWFGTDQFSRDVLSRMLQGARISLTVAMFAVAISITLGTAYGAIAGYVGGIADELMMRLIDACLSIPRVLLLIGVLSLWGQLEVRALIIVLGLTGWFGVGRIVRAEVLAVKGREFVTSARSLGAGHARVLVRHVLPHLLSPVLVAATVSVGHVIVAEAGLSFLNIGVRPPEASWGNIIRDGWTYISTAWWLSLFPGLALITSVLSVNVLADRLREALNPRQLPAR